VGPWWDGRPGGTPVLRGCGGGLLAEAYSRASAGVKRNPARYAFAWPWGHRDAVDEAWRYLPQRNLLYLATSLKTFPGGMATRRCGNLTIG
jgi:hypothetical protein